MKLGIQAIAFDAYDTLFDVHSVVARCNRKFPGRGAALSQLWRTKQLEYTWLRSLTGRYEDSWTVTESALVFACSCLSLACPPETRKELMESYLHLDVFRREADVGQNCRDTSWPSCRMARRKCLPPQWRAPVCGACSPL